MSMPPPHRSPYGRPVAPCGFPGASPTRPRALLDDRDELARDLPGTEVRKVIA
ncbi:hypothetical protein [Streptomyces albiflavescens]|uniref:hypothetical protein n=1 Tax=Streptomyces albiflavescens TaxID=1623582 RepID=UPI00166C879D|nr:hypothetical protein [Streptomyces albiflavescens]